MLVGFRTFWFRITSWWTILRTRSMTVVNDRKHDQYQLVMERRIRWLNSVLKAIHSPNCEPSKTCIFHPSDARAGGQVQPPSLLGHWKKTGLDLVGIFLVWTFIFHRALSEEQPFSRPTLREVREWTAPQISNLPPCDVTGVITFADINNGSGYMDDGTAGIFFLLAKGTNSGTNPDFEAGSLVRLRGQYEPGFFMPILFATNIQILGETNLPKPADWTLGEMLQGKADSQWVQLDGQICSIQEGNEWAQIRLRSNFGNATFDASLPSAATNSAFWVVGARIRANGVLSTILDRSHRFSTVYLNIPSTRFVTSLDDESTLEKFRHLEITKIDETLKGKRSKGLDVPVRVRGVVTYFKKDESFFLQDDSDGIKVMIPDNPFGRGSGLPAIRSGDEVEVVGMPMPHRSSGFLLSHQVTVLGPGRLPNPIVIGSLPEEENWDDESPNDVVVTVRGTFVNVVEHRALGSGFIRLPNNVLVDFEYIRQEPFAETDLNFDAGSLLKVTGVLDSRRVGTGLKLAHFIWVRDPVDIVVEKGGPWLNFRRSMYLLGFFGMVSAFFIVWGAIQRQRLARRRKELEMEHRQRMLAETKYRRLVEQAPDLIFRVAEDGTLLDWNPAVENLTGLSRKTLENASLASLLCDCSREVLQGRLGVVVGGESASGLFEVNIKSFGDRVVPMELSILRVDVSGEDPLIQCIGRDLSARAEAKLKLRRQAEEQKAILNSLCEAVLQIESTGKVISFNQATLSIFALTPEAAAATDWKLSVSRIVDPDGNEIPRSEFPATRSFATGQPSLGKVYGVDFGTDPRRWLLISTTAPTQNSAGQVVLVMTLLDFREQYEARRQLIEARKIAEAANEAKSEFLAVMSHEIRTPLNGVIGFTDLLLQCRLEGNQRHFAETIRDSGEALLSVVNEVLDFSKIEAGRLDLERTEFPLLQTIEEAVMTVSARAEVKGLELVVDIDPQIGPHWVGDRVRLRQILTNLVANAVKFTSKGTVELVVDLESDGALYCEIRDTGSGMSPEDVANLFTKFSQVRRSALSTEGGTGLGLAIVKQLVELMKGTVGCNSEEGKGSVFWFRLPSLASGSEWQRPPPTPQQISGTRILLVVESAMLRRAFRRRLEAWEYEITSAEAGEQAVQHWKDSVQEERRFDILIIEDGIFSGILATGAASLSELQENGRMGVILVGNRRRAEPVPVSWKSCSILWKPAVFPDALRQALLTAWAQIRFQSHPAMENRVVGQPRVLVVEDDRVSAMLAAYLLNRHQCDVQIARTGEEAIERCGTDSFDLILLDGTLPGMDGVTTARAIRSGTSRNRQVPMVALTGSLGMEDEVRFRTSGMDGVIAKPLRDAELKNVLSRWVQLPSSSDPA